MNEVGLIDGEEYGGGAFCREKLDRAGLDNAAVLRYLASSLGDITPFLKDGFGVGVFVSGDTGTVIGFTAPEK